LYRASGAGSTPTRCSPPRPPQRRSIEHFHHANPGRLAVVLTGTDLYRDLPQSREATRSLEIADRLVVLQEDAMHVLPAAARSKATVIFQSAPPIERRTRPRDRLECVAVGHLRAEKDPRTLFRAWSRLPRAAPIFMRHIGAPLDAELGAAAFEAMRRDTRYRYSAPSRMASRAPLSPAPTSSSILPSPRAART
jgi:hypothetical protein